MINIAYLSSSCDWSQRGDDWVVIGWPIVSYLIYLFIYFLTDFLFVIIEEKPHVRGYPINYPECRGFSSIPEKLKSPFRWSIDSNTMQTNEIEDLLLFTKKMKNGKKEKNLPA